jgi:prefoldin subunit 5
MNEGIWGTIVGTLLILAVGCAAPAHTVREESSELDVFLETLENRIGQLTTNIERLGKQMTMLQQAPDTLEPLLRELRALDLAGWHLHQQQWMLQRAHLLVAKQQLRRARETPQAKPQLLAQWTQEVQQYQTALEELHQQRHGLEHKYFEREAQVVDQYLR